MALTSAHNTAVTLTPLQALGDNPVFEAILFLSVHVWGNYNFQRTIRARRYTEKHTSTDTLSPDERADAVLLPEALSFDSFLYFLTQ